MNIWTFNQQAMRALASWNVVNILIGVLLTRCESPLKKAVGSQNISWGFINITIAFFGGFFTRRRYAKRENPNAPHVLKKEAKAFRRLLWFNAFLDLGYIFGGSRLAQSDSESRKGFGYGIMIQGALLFVFDVAMALTAPRHNDE